MAPALTQIIVPALMWNPKWWKTLFWLFPTPDIYFHPGDDLPNPVSLFVFVLTVNKLVAKKINVW